MIKRREVYLDGAANTPMDRSVWKVLIKYSSPKFVGNSMSIHDRGAVANMLVDDARGSLSRDLNINVNDIYITSGATESNNWAIKSIAAQQVRKHSLRNKILYSATEHDSVCKCCEQVAGLGIEVIKVHPSNGKFIRLCDIEKYDLSRVCLLCVMGVNNETGMCNDVLNVTKYAKEHQVPTLVDCTQVITYGGSYMRLGSLYPDATFMSFSAHKIYGPTGIGCLLCRDSSLLEPMIIGGAQERGMRGGTTNTAGVLAMATAVHNMVSHDYTAHYMKLLFYLKNEIREQIPGAYFNVWPSHANIVSVNFSTLLHIQSLAAMLATYGICVSAGSACDAVHDETIGEFNGSHVLLEMGLSENEIRNTIRISFTKHNTKRDIDYLIKVLKEIIKNGKS